MSDARETRPDPKPDPLPEPPAGFDPISEEPLGPMVRALGFTLTGWSKGFARVEMPVSEMVINRQGVIHGGALATLLDTVAGYSGTFCPYPGRVRRAFTLSLTTQFIAAVGEGAVTAEARVTGGGRSVFFSEAEARAADGRLLASATGVFKYRGASGDLWGEPRS